MLLYFWIVKPANGITKPKPQTQKKHFYNKNLHNFYLWYRGNLILMCEYFDREK